MTIHTNLLDRPDPRALTLCRHECVGPPLTSV